MSDQFSDLPFENERIDALTPSDLSNFIIQKHSESSSDDSEFACILSHLKAIKRGYDENHEYFFVCEDDMFIPNIDTEKLFHYMRKYETEIGDSVELLQMVTNGHPFIIQLYNEFFVKRNTLFKSIKEHIYSSAGIYMVSRNGAKKILDTYVKDYERRIYDLSHSHWTVADNLLYIAVKSHILTYPFFISNTNFGSDIHDSHCQNHIIANNIVKQIHEKNNQLDIIIPNPIQKKRIQMVLHSGMCNQIFMIFATIAYSLKHNIDYILYSGNTRTIDNGNPSYFNNLFSKIKHKTTPHIMRNCALYQEPEFAYHDIPTTEYPCFNIRGFFQSYKYFEDQYEQIMNITGMNDLRKEVYQEFHSMLGEKPSISIHFRIGDYANLQYNHPIAPVKYYSKSLQYLETKINVENYNIFYFCQEVDNKQVDNIILEINSGDIQYNFIKVPDNIPDWKQMLLISFCNHHIIANSTFSWWGAYMCQNPNKIVCTPLKKWFGPALSKHNVKDLCPTQWTIIDF